jgi:phosphatidate cytidylyltransferase
MHLKRWLTGIIAIPCLAILLGPAPRCLFYLVLLMATFAGIREFYGITAPDLPRSARWSSYFLSLLLFIVIYAQQILLEPVIILLFTFIPMSLYVFLRPSPGPERTGDIGKAVLGPIYVGLPLSMLLHTARYYPRGNIWIAFLLVVIFAGDTGAFYFGRLMGRHKLHEAVSPGKTWEGAIGGVLTGSLTGLLFMNAMALHPLTSGIAMLASALSIAGQIGDLAESLLKRNHGMKDSGQILPGHGGVLDRIDGLLFAIPVFYAFLWFRLT